MSVYKTFATNLRNECLRFDSIADVCRGMDINRQQFNKYLSGQALPNQRTLRKIAAYFDLKEEALFVDGPSRQSSTSSAKTPEYAERSTDRLEKFIGGWARLNTGNVSNNLPQTNSGSLSDGYYYSYTPLELYHDFAVRALIKVVTKGTCTLFFRRTSYFSNANHENRILLSKHQGIVLSDQTASFLIGRNRVFPNEISVLKINHSMIENEPIRSGVALVHGIESEMKCKICLERIGNGYSKGKFGIGNLGAYPYTHPSISEPVRNHFQREWIKSDSLVSVTGDERREIKLSIQSLLNIK